MIENFLKKNNNGKSFLVGESVSSISFFRYLCTYFIKLVTPLVKSSQSQEYWKVTDLRALKKKLKEKSNLWLCQMLMASNSSKPSVDLSTDKKLWKKLKEIWTLQISAMIHIKHSNLFNYIPKEFELVECINPLCPTGRIYAS